MLLLAINISQKIDEIELRRKGFPPIVVKNLSQGTYAVNDRGETASIEVPVAITITDRELPQINNIPNRELVKRMKEHATILTMEYKKRRQLIKPRRIARESVSAIMPELKDRKLNNAIDTVRQYISIKILKRKRSKKRPFYIDDRCKDP